uniref:RING-type E3 ubiquitin transferase n=2 Tax=Parascaris univalens TaxID=6257 RepID=A0A915ADI7_PARUN
MSSVHDGVSCDGCMAPNFSGDRYKCLRCYDFDLCARCYEEERSEGRSETRNIRDSSDEHQPTHPMQCIMTQQDFELTYQGDQSHNWDKWRVVIFTCPVCGAQGLSRDRLVSHVIEEHSTNPRSPSAQRQEMACPICISTDFYRVGFGDYMPNQLTDMAAHMQEHHTQTQPSATIGGSSQSARGGGLSEFLRDRDHRRVTMQSVPLIANDSDFDEPEGEAVRRSTSRNTTSQRSDAFPRIRRRLIERSTNDAQSAEEENAGQPTFGFRPLSSTRQRTTPSQQGGSTSSSVTEAQGADAMRMRFMRSANTVGESSRPANQSATHSSGSRSSVSSQRSVRSSTPTNCVAFSRAFHSSMSAFSRPNVPRLQQVPNGAQSPARQGTVSIRGNAQGDRNAVASNRWAGEVARSILSAPEQVAHRNEVNQSNIDARASVRREREQHVDEQSRSSDSRRTAPPTFAAVRSSSTTGLPAFATAQKNESSVENVPSRETSSQESTVNVMPVEGIVVNSSGRAVLPLPSLNLSTSEESSASWTAEKSQPSKNSKEGGSVQNGSCVGSKRSVLSDNRSKVSHVQALWPVLTAGTPICPLPVLRLKANKKESCLRTEGETLVEVKQQNSHATIAEDDIPPLRLVMRVGRPLQNAFAQGRAKTLNAQSSDVGDSCDRQCSQPFQPNFLLRYSRRHQIPGDGASTENTSSELAVPERARLDELTMIPVNRAIEVIKRLDSRGARSHRPPPAEIAPNTLIRRAEATHSTTSVGSTRSGNKPAASNPRTEQKTRGAARPRSKARDARDEDLGEYFTNAFKPPDIGVILDGVVVERKRFFKPFQVRSEEDRERFFIPWLRKEHELDEQISLCDLSQSADSERPAAAGKSGVTVPLNVGNRFRVEKTITLGVEDEVTSWDSENGVDAEAFLEKSEDSSPFAYAPSLYIVAGPMHGMLNAQDGGENNYWNDYRFLHNRRDVFLLKKSVDMPPENTFDPFAWRFPRQLVLGALDAPISMFLHSQYLPDMFERVLRTNLRELLQAKRSSTEQSTENTGADEPKSVTAFELGGSKGVHCEQRSREGPGTSYRHIDVHPDLWYFLDLAGFVEFTT